MIRCETSPSCNDPALLTHSTGCGGCVCATHAEPYGNCAICGEPWELAVA